MTKITLEQARKDYERLGEYIKQLEQEDSQEWPKVGDSYYCISDSGIVREKQWDDALFYDELRQAIGNIYRTHEQAQAVVDLKKHIYKFPMPEKDEFYRFITSYLHIEGNTFEKCPRDRADYHCGFILPERASGEDQLERIRLIKAAYNIK